MKEQNSTRQRWHALQRELGLRLSDRLFQEVARRTQDARGLRHQAWSLRLAHGLAASVYAVAAAFGIAGAWVLLTPWHSIFTGILGLMLILLCVAARPRLVELPDRLVTRADFPMLHELCERIAKAMQAPPIAGIGVSAEFNANYRSAGWAMRRYVELGAPLLAILSPQEKVALIAHEMSHGANGDPLRGQFLHGAVHTLSTWAVALRPLALGRSGEDSGHGPIMSLFVLPFELVMLAASELVFLLVKGLLMLVMRQSQRAEYLADHLAATVAGTGAMRDMLQKSYLFEVIDAALRVHALTGPARPFAPALLTAIGALSPADLEARSAESRAAKGQVDVSHPPTALRIDMLAVAPPCLPMVLVSPAEESLLEAEFDRFASLAQQEIMNQKLADIYG